jgi:hypothetical protein
MSDLSNDTKKQTMKSRETIPLSTGMMWENKHSINFRESRALMGL